MKYDAWSKLTMPLYCEIYVNFTYSVNAISIFSLPKDCIWNFEEVHAALG